MLDNANTVHAQPPAAFDKLGFADGAETVGVTGGEAEYADIVCGGEREEGGREEHRFVIGVRD